MTYKEKYKMTLPASNDEEVEAMVRAGCPHEFWNSPEPEYCAPLTEACVKCWDREFEEIGETHSTIKDSGDRTEFESGGVRDMREGKGRCDLSPLEVAARVFCDPILNPRDYDANLNDIAEFLKTNKTSRLYYVLRRFSMEHYENYETMLLEVAKHFEEGAKKYGEDNWRRGLPVWCYIDSAVRHYLKWRRGDTDEPHDRAFVWNLMCCIWEVDYGEKARKNT